MGRGGGGAGQDHVSHKINWAFRSSIVLENNGLSAIDFAGKELGHSRVTKITFTTHTKINVYNTELNYKAITSKMVPCRFFGKKNH